MQLPVHHTSLMLTPNVHPSIPKSTLYPRGDGEVADCLAPLSVARSKRSVGSNPTPLTPLPLLLLDERCIFPP
jgi:hypothetical protein